MDRIEDCISFLTGKAAQQISRRSRERLAKHGVTPVQYAVLRVLSEDAGQSGAELSARLAIDSATITGVIDRLEAAGLVDRRADDRDRRIHRVFATARARRRQARLDREMDALNAEVAGEFGRQAPAFWAMLRQLGDVGR